MGGGEHSGGTSEDRAPRVKNQPGLQPRRLGAPGRHQPGGCVCIPKAPLQDRGLGSELQVREVGLIGG